MLFVRLHCRHLSWSSANQQILLFQQRNQANKQANTCDRTEHGEHLYGYRTGITPLHATLEPTGAGLAVHFLFLQAYHLRPTPRELHQISPQNRQQGIPPRHARNRVGLSSNVLLVFQHPGQSIGGNPIFVRVCCCFRWRCVLRRAGCDV